GRVSVASPASVSEPFMTISLASPSRVGRVGSEDVTPSPVFAAGAVGDPRAVPVLVRRLDPGVPMPTFAHPGDAGADLATAVDIELAPGERAVVPTGIALALPAGYAAFVHPRSGLAAKHGVTMVNAPGTIDVGYRGEVRVILINTDPRATV